VKIRSMTRPDLVGVRGTVTILLPGRLKTKPVGDIGHSRPVEYLFSLSLQVIFHTVGRLVI